MDERSYLQFQGMFLLAMSFAAWGLSGSLRSFAYDCKPAAWFVVTGAVLFLGVQAPVAIFAFLSFRRANKIGK